MVTVIDRAGWGAKAPKSRHTIALPTPRLWIHHTGTEQHGAAGVRAIQAFHMRPEPEGGKGWNDIAYSWLIDDDGTIYEGRGTGVAGGHTQGDNSRSHAICLMGNFENRAPAAQALEAVIWLARHGADLDWWYPTLGGHRDAPGAQTACPGRYLYDLLPVVRQRVAAPTQEDDMALADTDKPIIQAAAAAALDHDARRVEGITSHERYLEVLLDTTRAAARDAAAARADVAALRAELGQTPPAG